MSDIKPHPDFSDTDADIVLYSKDHVGFRFYTVILKRASGWFRGLFTLPQASQNQNDAPEDSLHMEEESDVLESLLSMIGGLPFLQITSMDFAERLLEAAQKYDMQGPIAILRLVFMNHIPLHPLRVYGIACYMGWLDEVRSASTHTLTLDLGSEDSMKELSRMRHGSYVAKLNELHRRRRDDIGMRLELLFATKLPLHGNCELCPSKIKIPNKIRDGLNTKWRCNLEAKPFGTALTFDDILARPGLLPIATLSCSSCRNVTFLDTETADDIRQIFDSLPTSVEL